MTAQLAIAFHRAEIGATRAARRRRATGNGESGNAHPEVTNES